MRLLLFILTVFVAVACIEKSAEAQNGAWCAYYDTGGGGSRNCGFATFEQCLATVRDWWELLTQSIPVLAGDTEWTPEALMANVSKLIFGAAIAAASMTNPALAAHRGKSISAYQNRVTRASQGSGGVHNCVPTPSCPGLPYCDPCSGISYPGGEPGGP